jgi:hypothetical protein
MLKNEYDRFSFAAEKLTGVPSPPSLEGSILW